MEKSKAIEAVSDGFNRSLANLSIQPARFRAMPLQQRKLAIREAIYEITGQTLNEIDYLLDRSNFRSKCLAEFSPEQIRQHKTVVDALIALVCLGDPTFIRPLIIYLSFPERRLSIIIEPILRAVLKKSIHASIYRLPTDKDISNWRSWAMRVTQPTMEDYSNILLTEIGDEKIKWHHFSSSEPSDSSWLATKDVFFKSKLKYFSYNDADFYTEKLFPSLKKQDYSKFIDSLDDFVIKNPNKGDFDIITACINDTIKELDLPSSSLKKYCLNFKDDRKLSPRTYIILFWGLGFTKNRRLANKFSLKIAGENSTRPIITIISDILTKSENVNTINLYANIFKELDGFSDDNIEALFELAPITIRIIFRWMRNMFSSEIESISIMGCEHSSKRKEFFPFISSQFMDNDKLLNKLAEIKKSSNHICQEFGIKILILYDSRQKFQKSFLDNDDIDTELSISEYKKLIDSWIQDVSELQPIFVSIK